MARVSFVAACPAAVEVWSAILVFPTRSYCWFPAVVNFPTAGGIPAVAKVSAVNVLLLFCSIKNHNVSDYWTI
jgi:hypothetical protein